MGALNCGVTAACPVALSCTQCGWHGAGASNSIGGWGDSAGECGVGVLRMACMQPCIRPPPRPWCCSRRTQKWSGNCDLGRHSRKSLLVRDAHQISCNRLIGITFQVSMPRYLCIGFAHMARLDKATSDRRQFDPLNWWTQATEMSGCVWTGIQHPPK